MVIEQAIEEIKRISGKTIEKTNQDVYQKAFSTGNCLRNAMLKVMSGKRSGRVYKKVGTYGKRRTKATKELMGQYKRNLRGGQLYQASAPFEPPAVRTGTLRRSFTHRVQEQPNGKGIKVLAVLETRNKYAAYLEYGTNKMAPRPYVEPIKQEAIPEIERLFQK